MTSQSPTVSDLAREIAQELSELNLNPADVVVPEFVDTYQAARYLGIAEKTLANWRTEGIGPRFHRVSHSCIRYRRDDLERFMNEHLVGSPDSVVLSVGEARYE